MSACTTPTAAHRTQLQARDKCGDAYVEKNMRKFAEANADFACPMSGAKFFPTGTWPAHVCVCVRVGLTIIQKFYKQNERPLHGRTGRNRNHLQAIFISEFSSSSFCFHIHIYSWFFFLAFYQAQPQLLLTGRTSILLSV